MEKQYDALSTVHKALEQSQFQQESNAMVQGSYRIDPSIKERAEKICEQNNSTLSAFVRNCISLMVSDYQPVADDGQSE